MSATYFEARKINPEFYRNYQLPRYLTSRLPKDRNAHILDFGCGYGQMLLALKQLGYKNLAGLDIDEKAVKYCLAKNLDVFQSESLSDLLKDSRRYDLILISHVLEHLPKDLIVPILKTLSQMLREDGEIVVMVPNAQSNTGCYWAYEDFTHTTLFTCGAIYYVLKMAGFARVEFLDLDGLDGIPYPKRLVKSALLQLYKCNLSFWNRVTGSAFHSPSPQCFTYEIKVSAKK